jgi:hypothetical protein
VFKLDERLLKIHTLIKDAEAELEVTMNEGEARKRTVKCSVCDTEGHTARTCPNKLPAATI